jgi:ergothioneine biosynthesis protein EgtB
MDSRNHSLHVAQHIEDALRAPVKAEQAQRSAAQTRDRLTQLANRLGRLGWVQERWIGRNPKRARGLQCLEDDVRLASIEAHADAWWEPGTVRSREAFDAATQPELASVRAYLLHTLESSLDLLERADPGDDGLYFFRMAIAWEDLVAENLVRLANAWGVPWKDMAHMAGSALQCAPQNQISVSDVAARIGAPADGFAWDNERAQHVVRLPAFEIDADCVSWQQFVEFVDDGGYDREELWHPDGWHWLQNHPEGRRGPRGVEQIGIASGAVMQWNFGNLSRRSGSQAALQVNWFEADAWCRWARRRLPTEYEWEYAAVHLGRQGFTWGQVWEWTANSFKPYDGFVAQPWASYSQPHFGHCKVIRGASFASRKRSKVPTHRAFATPERDDMFIGFRSVAL